MGSIIESILIFLSIIPAWFLKQRVKRQLKAEAKLDATKRNQKAKDAVATVHDLTARRIAKTRSQSTEDMLDELRRQSGSDRLD